MSKKKNESLPKGKYEKPEVITKTKREINKDIWLDGFKAGFNEGFETGLSFDLNVCRECAYKLNEENRKKQAEDPGIN